MDFMSLLGSMVQSTQSARTSGSSIGGGLQDILTGLMGAGQTVKQKVGGDNLAAGGIGALLGALMGNSRSTTMNSLGGGMMGLLGMMAYKALTSSMSSSSGVQAAPQEYTPATPQQQASDAEIILLAMIDAAKADGQIDADEFSKITSNLKNSGVGQDGMNYVLQKLQGPMETAKIVAATKGRPDLAAQVYSASLMTITVDTDAERQYLAKLAGAMGLSSEVVRNIEQITSSAGREYSC